MAQYLVYAMDFGDRINMDTNRLLKLAKYMDDQSNYKELAKWTGVAVLTGYGLLKMKIAKKHIDVVSSKIQKAKDELFKETNGDKDIDIRPGDNLIRHAFQALTEMYFGQIQVQWEEDLKFFIEKYS